MNKKLIPLLLLVVACTSYPTAQLTPAPYPITDSVAVRPTVFYVNVIRNSPDWYVTQEGVAIQTKDCVEEANGENAVLVWEQYGYVKRIDFASGGTCKVINLGYAN